MPDAIQHIPVLQDATVAALLPRAGHTYADGTTGGGGHLRALCSQLDAGSHVFALDRDPETLARTQATFTGVDLRVDFVHANYADLPDVLAALEHPPITGGIMLDLGVSDFQIKDPARGFSFQQSGPLDMRMDPSKSGTAADLVNTLTADELADIFYRYGDERLSRPISRRILERRPLTETRELATIASDVYRHKGVKAKNIHPATRIFQALRIAVNGELDALNRFLGALPTLLAPGGRIAIITFHSLEDRAVKAGFRQLTASCICPPRQPGCNCDHVATFKLVGKAVTPTEEELTRNPQARSAKLRVAERV